MTIPFADEGDKPLSLPTRLSLSRCGDAAVARSEGRLRRRRALGRDRSLGAPTRGLGSCGTAAGMQLGVTDLESYSHDDLNMAADPGGFKPTGSSVRSDDQRLPVQAHGGRAGRNKAPCLGFV